MSSYYNHFQTKRAAHQYGRHNAGWSPFGHTWQPKSVREAQKRHETWDGGRLEEQPVDESGGSPITHFSTAPGFFAEPEEANGSDTNGAAAHAEKKDEEAARDAENRQQESGETFGSQQTTLASTADAGATQPAPPHKHGLFHRKKHGNGEKVAAEDAAAKEEKKKKKAKGSRLYKPVYPKEPFTVWNQVQRTIFNSWINVLLIAAPVGIALNYVESIDRKVIFVVNFIAIVPLAAMLSFATEEIALRTGETLGGLLNATFGNAVELIVAIIALIKDQVLIVQTSLIGSMLSNLLLVMGMCFFFGGLRRREQYFNTTVAQTAASLLALAVASVIVPTVFDSQNLDDAALVAELSHGVALILLIVYAAYLYFQLFTHHEVFSEQSQKVPAKPFKSALPQGAIARGFAGPVTLMAGAHGLAGSEDREKISKHVHEGPTGAEDEEEAEDPQLHFWVAVATLAGSTVIIALCAEFMVDGIDAVTKGGALKPEFVGLILLPIVGNAAEHATAVTVAIKDKMDLAIGVAVGSSMQIALLVIPLVVVIGWGMGKEAMTLSFDPFQVAVLFVAVLLVNYLIADGKSHWLEGMLLMCLYAIIGTCSFFYPVKPGQES